jgi:hypothetical protein
VEFRDHRKHECGKVSIAHADRVRMGPGLEHNLLVLRERLVDVHREPIEVAEGRHHAQLAVGKQVLHDDIISLEYNHSVRANWPLRLLRHPPKIRHPARPSCPSRSVPSVASSFKGM